MKRRHIFFDLDHTLWDFEKNSGLTFQKLFEEYQLDFSIEDFLEVYKPINLKYWKLYRQEKVSKSDLRYFRLKEVFENLNFTVSEKIIVELADKYMEYLPHFTYLFDGTLELLNYLKPKYKLHIITNGFEEVQLLKMKSSGLLSFFDQIVTSESVGAKKPNSKVFYHALQVAGASTENSIMIGDSLEADVHGALAIGLEAIHCNFTQEVITDRSITTVNNLLELKQYL